MIRCPPGSNTLSKASSAALYLRNLEGIEKTTFLECAPHPGPGAPLECEGRGWQQRDCTGLQEDLLHLGYKCPPIMIMTELQPDGAHLLLEDGFQLLRRNHPADRLLALGNTLWTSL